MSIPRSVINVIDQLLDVIPMDEVKLIEELNKYKNSLWNRAPETLYTNHCWIPLQKILQKRITTIDCEWKEKILQIFNNT
jgi:hypothetical protein